MGNHDQFLDQARRIVGEKAVITDEQDLAPWLTDWRGRYRGQAIALASPATAHELAEIVKLCAATGTPIVPQGGNSGMVGGATPDDSGSALLLSLRRMDTLAIEADAGTARCGAGVILQSLHDAAGQAGLRFPLSLGGKGSATVGGLVSTNAGGTQVLRHGVMRALVLGLEVVTPAGDILDLTAPLKKDNRGFDLKQLYIGSEGTLGIVTAAVLKLVPAIAERRVVWAGLDSVATARKLLLHCQDRLGQALEGFEIVPATCLDTVVDYLPDAQYPLAGRHAWNALLEFDADSKSADTLGDAVENCMADAMAAGLVDDAVIAASESQAEALWALRESIAPAEKAHRPAVQHDIAVPPEAMPDVLSRLESLIPAEFPDHEVRGFGHLGDGNIHLHVLAPQDSPGADWPARFGKPISAFVYRFVTEAGGTISAEHGIGQDKLDVLAQTRDPAEIAVMQAVKSALDPDGVLNPGKLVPGCLAPGKRSA